MSPISLVQSVIEVAEAAGQEILKVYRAKDFEIETKSDDSPITKADRVANHLILKRLRELETFPIVSEESPVDFSTRKNWDCFWLVDPLDGTKDFIARNDEFTVNIALIEKDLPVLGVVHIPALGLTYWATKGGGAFKNALPIFNQSTRKGSQLIAAKSRFHSTPQSDLFFKTHGIQDVREYGAALKLCKLAEGEIDVYPRLEGTKEWDTAAAQIIVTEAGGKLIAASTQKPLTYNKENIQNPHFIACRADLNF